MPDMNNLTEHEEQALEYRMQVLDDMKPSAEETERRTDELHAKAVENICGENHLLKSLQKPVGRRGLPPRMIADMDALEAMMKESIAEMTAPPKVVAFTGLRMSGKSTAAKVLIDLHRYVDVKFADPLKNMLRAFYKICGINEIETERRLEGDLKEVPCKFLLGKTPRYAMQTLGTEWRDLMGPHMWSDITKMRIENGSCGCRIVVSDYRFKHEATTLVELGALKIRITNPNTIKDAFSSHASETTILEIPEDIVIHNDGTSEELQGHVLKAVEGWGGV